MTNSCSGIWIGNLRYGVQKEDLRVFFGDLSTNIQTINLPESNQDGQIKNKGFATITFDSNESARKALALSESILKGRQVLIKMQNDYTKKRSNGNSNQPSKKQVPSSTIFLGNLGFDVEKKDLLQLAQQFKRIVGVRIGTFQDTGRCKGFGYLDFEDLQSAKAAFNSLIGTKIKGRLVRIEFASEQAAKKGKPWLDNPQKPKRHKQEESEKDEEDEEEDEREEASEKEEESSEEEDEKKEESSESSESSDNESNEESNKSNRAN